MRYFGRDFLKFTLGFLFIVAVSLLIMVAASAYASGISKIVFTTDVQNIKPNTISEAITIQTQDSSGNSLSTTETLDLDFYSSSPTGQFVNSAGNPVTTTMNKGTANRTFYYKDSNEGNFVLKIKAVGRETLQTWEASQNITVSGSGSQTSVNTGEVLGQSSEESLSSQSATGAAVAPSYATIDSQLETSIGNDRITAPGSPISFQALIKKNKSTSGTLKFSWSFGDGAVGDGPLVTHTYKYPGEYAVILNTKIGDNFAVSRLKVKVLEPALNLFDRGGYIEIQNNANSEINLFNWKIVIEHKAFIFQPDTIILPKNSLKIDKSILSMKGEAEADLVLKNFLGEIVAKAVTGPRPNEAMLGDQVSVMRSEVEHLYSVVNNLNQSISNPVKNSNTEGLVAGESTEYREMLKNSTTSLLGEVIFESKEEKGVWQKIRDFFGNLFD